MFDFLRNMKDAKSVAKIEGALLALEGDFDAATKAQARAREALEAAIDAGDARALDQAEQALDGARRQLERLEVARGSLERRLVDARERELVDRLDGAAKAATARRDAVRRRIEREMIPALRTVCAILDEMRAADAEIGAANDAFLSAGRPGRVDRVEETFTPSPPHQYGPLFEIANTTAIRAVPEWQVPGWRWREPGLDVNGLLAAAMPPGSIGGRGDLPRAHVARPAHTPGFVPTIT